MAARFELERYDGKGDFGIWRKKMKALLVHQKVAKAIQDPKDIPATVTQEQRLEMDEIAFSLMILYLSDTVLRRVNEETTALGIWKKLEELFMKKSLSNKILLKEKFFGFKMNSSKNLEENLDEFNKICLDLANSGEKLEEENQAVIVRKVKPRYLQSFFCRTSLDSELVVRKVRSWEERARNCYAEPIKMSSDEFVKLILVDGCFIVEFMMRFCIPELRDPVDRLFDGTLRIDLICDLIKLENQLPFFVLESLFKLYPSNNHIAKISFTELSYNVFAKSYRNEGAFYVSGRIVDHFVHLLWQDFIPPSSSEQAENSVIFIGNSKLLQPPTATELNEAGVIIKRAKNKSIGNVISGITFRNGVLEIPNIDIYDYFETYIRNLIAFEQCHKVDYYVTHFAIFMDDLINTEKDVSFLIERGIISNHLGSNDDVCKLFNNLGKQISIGDNFYFNNVSRKIHEYCGTRRHRWMASLRRDYFNTPWASISFAAAAFLLILTLIQTIFSGLSIK